MPDIIKILNQLPQIVADDWQLIRDSAPSEHQSFAHKIFPFAALNDPGNAEVFDQVQAVWIAPDDDFEASIATLLRMQLIAVDFPSFRDGRGYSIATLLRTRYGWNRELRAVGDVLRDQLNYMRRCGFDAFAVRADKDIRDAIKSFSHYTVQYQGAVDNPLPLFRKRHGGTE
jgi:uncharacterized protein (DUF934 family)